VEVLVGYLCHAWTGEFKRREQTLKGKVLMTKLNTLTDGLISELRDLYSAESQLIKALPKMEKKATNQSLKDQIRLHLVETEGQLNRLNEVGGMLQEKLTGKVCKAMQGLIEEGREVLEEESENDALIDALLIGVAQRVEHYEIAAYGMACAMARELGEDDIASLLEESLDEEKAADQKLSLISEDEVLIDASSFAEEDIKVAKRKTSPQRSQKKTSNVGKVFALVGGLIILGQAVPSAFAEEGRAALSRESAARQYKTDDTGRNKRDRDNSRITAEDQNQDAHNIELLANIRKELVENDSLSAYGKNVKVIVEKGRVYLRGPVRTAIEKNWIEQAAVRVAAGHKVVNELEIAPN